MVPERPSTEDIIINKMIGKRLTREEEFVFEYETQEKTRDVKRRLLQRSTNGSINLDAFPDFPMAAQNFVEEPNQEVEMVGSKSDHQNKKDSEKENQEPVKEEETHQVQE